MNIGIIGSGGMGCCLAEKFSALGHNVSIANSRGPESLQKIAAEIGANGVSVKAAMKNKNVIIVSIPQKNVPGLPKYLFDDLHENVVVIETGNYYPNLRDGNIASLDLVGIDSMWVQQQLAFPVIKVFNSILADSIRDKGKAKGSYNRIALAVSGDSSKAKQIVFELVEELGFDPFDAGDISQSWKQQPGSPIYCRDIDLATLKQRLNNLGDSWEKMRDIILFKRRADEALMKTDYPAYLRILQEG